MEQKYLSCPAIQHPVISRIVGRFHVSESILSIVRQSIIAMQKSRKKFFSMPKKHRRYMIAACIQHHKINRNIYRQVMTGKTIEFEPRYFFDAIDTNTLIAADPMLIVFPQEDAA